MSAAALTKKLLATSFLHDELEFLDCLNSVLKEFLSTRSPIFPRQVRQYLSHCHCAQVNISFTIQLYFMIASTPLVLYSPSSTDQSYVLLVTIVSFLGLFVNLCVCLYIVVCICIIRYIPSIHRMSSYAC